MADERPPVAALTARFAAVLGRPIDAGVGEQLDALVAAGRTAWPDLHVPGEDFAAGIADRIGTSDDVGRRLEQVSAPDLHLALACLGGGDAAIAALRTRYEGALDGALGRFRQPRAFNDEVKQDLWQRLFVGPTPAIAQYSGRGALKNWLIVAALRRAMDQLRARKRETPADDDFFIALPDSREDPEIEHLKRRYTAEFKAAFEQAVRDLSPRERNLLRHRFLDGLTSDDLSVRYQVHRATAARWVGKAQDELLRHTRSRMQTRIGLSADRCESVVALIRSQLDLSLSRYFAARVSADESG